jgi:hypothetical protein
MKQHLTERTIKTMVPEIDRDVLVYDEEVTGFAICVYRSRTVHREEVLEVHLCKALVERQG